MNEGTQLKQELLAHARENTEASITTARGALDRLTESLANETKSSAGDKFETGRAMVHMEQQKLGEQLVKLGQTRQAIDRISAKSPTGIVSEGSLVATNRGLYLVGIGLGKVRLNGRVIFCTSLESPIGRLLLGREVGEEFTFNELDFVVLGVT